ncbi:MAG: ABC transporter substrate-binding protein [candidate division Zixibacteria bacterium]|nr:ABC transporter substrate-binding protein [candidate division Zixibacteria bacterium]MDH3937096.1 ABC transporter substrate-binding protein [candidate division Zixibacteria bacterium]MDH4034003.1 ABC transporter substrate-binding protein [candidate division Zixibacteria bacterium]
MNEWSKRVLVCAVILYLLAGSAVAQAGEDIHIGIITRDSLKSTLRTLQGARKVIKRTHPGATFHEFQVGDNVAGNLTIIDSLDQVSPKVILTVGSSATEFAKTNIENVPTVFSAVKYPVLSGYVKSMAKPGGSITGASLNVPVDLQFKYFKKIIPGLKDVGVLYTDNTAALIAHARVVADNAGITLVPMLVNDFKELPKALDSLAKITDGIWSVADPNLFDPRSTRYILMNTLRKGVPFMGFSRHVVESGALFALDFDYKAIGQQAGEIVKRILAGRNPGQIPVTQADFVWFHYNEKTAGHVGITIPDDLVAVAKEVYR